MSIFGFVHFIVLEIKCNIRDELKKKWLDNIARILSQPVYRVHHQTSIALHNSLDVVLQNLVMTPAVMSLKNPNQRNHHEKRLVSGLWI